MSDLYDRLQALAVTVGARLRALEAKVAALGRPKITVGASPPSSPSVNDLWIDTGG